MPLQPRRQAPRRQRSFTFLCHLFSEIEQYGMSGAKPDAVAVKAAQRAQWNKLAPGYHQACIEKPWADGRLFEEFSAFLVPILSDAGPVRILDVASASGEPALTLAKALPQAQVVATDLADAFVPFGEARAAAAGLGECVSFKQADAEDLSQFPDSSFHAVTCSLGLMFMPNYQKALAEFSRVLKPGGSLALAVWQALERVPFLEIIMQISHELDATVEPTAPTTCKFGQPEALRELLRGLQAAGLSGVQRRDLEVAYRFPAESWWEDLVALPLPLCRTLDKLRGEGQPNISDAVRVRMRDILAGRGFMRPDSSVCMGGNACHFITARKAG